MKICVVDDEDLLVKGIRFNLKNEGYEVVTGSNGLEAVDLARNDKINSIFKCIVRSSNHYRAHFFTT